MRVAVDCHMVAQQAAGDAGNARYHARLARALAETRSASDHVTALIARPEAWDAVARIASAPVPAHGLSRLGPLGARRLRELDADVAVFSYIGPLGAPCALALVVHDATFVTHPEWLSRRARVLLRTLVPPMARRAAAVLTPSETAKGDVCTALGLPTERVHVVSPGPAAAFHPRAGAGERVRRRFGIERYVLWVGDLGPRKNLPALAGALARLGRRDLELVVVGKTLPNGSHRMPGVAARAVGRVDDDTLADLYSAAAVTVQPSLYEGFGLPVIEALACASPVVASNAGAIPEVAGDAALLVEPTPEGIAEGLRAALEPATADDLRARGPDRAARYSLGAMGAQGWAAARAARA